MKNIVKKYELILTEVKTNNNKVWKGILYDDGTGESQFGRVGYSLQTCEYPTHVIVEEKMRQKIKKGYTELKIISDGIANQSTAKNLKNSELNTIAKTQLVKIKNPILSKLIDRLVAANVHKITSNTQISYNSTTGLFATPLGIVTMDGLIDARNILASMAPLVRNRSYGDRLDNLVSQYLRIIPQNVGMKLNVRSLLPDDTAIQKQNDLIDSLESSYQALQTSPKKSSSDSKSMEQVFNVDMDVCNDRSVRTRLENWFERSKKSMHHYDRVKVREVFTIKIHDMHNAFESNLNPIQEVFHGSSMANCLSILKSGLKISPPSTAAIAGSLFGRGLYGATSSSKSMGYTFGRWGQGGVGDSGWLFICDFALGKTYSTTAYGCNKPNGYDSVWAKSSANGLKNDEIIVYRESQAKIKYLLEVK